ncbi:MAG: type II secretion system protein [Phycisphaerales bacterium JB038]
MNRPAPPCRPSPPWTEQRTAPGGGHAFSLIELLVVIAVVAALIGLLVPTLAATRGQGRSAACASNLRQLGAANELYVADHAGLYAPGAMDIVLHNRHRWHGTRASTGVPFVPEGGSLTPYLGGTGVGPRLRACPSFTGVLDDPSAFERGCGGYGYNNAYVGTQRTRCGPDSWSVVSDRQGAPAHLFVQPAGTVMFGDTAFAAGDLIEYSFLEPRFHPDRPQARLDPSTHFRHQAHANVVWLDGHVSTESRSHSWSSGLYPADSQSLGLGWFGADDDNRLFDPDV